MCYKKSIKMDWDWVPCHGHVTREQFRAILLFLYRWIEVRWPDVTCACTSGGLIPLWESTIATEFDPMSMR
jgi:hypothetical protein